MILKFNVRGEKLTCDKDLIITEGNKGTCEAEFVFDAVWDNYAKICIFENEGECLPVAVINNKAILPLAEKMSAKIGVVGVKMLEDGAASTRISTNMLAIDIKNGAASSGAIEKLEKDAEVWEIHLAEMNAVLKDVEDAGKDALTNLDEKRAEIVKIVDDMSDDIEARSQEAQAVIDDLGAGIEEKSQAAQQVIDGMEKEVAEASDVVAELVRDAMASEQAAQNSAEDAQLAAEDSIRASQSAQSSEAGAADYAGISSQAYEDLLNMINSGDIVLAQNGKLPLSSIPATATQEIYVVESEDELTTLTAQRGDLAELVEEIDGVRTITKTWQCLGDATVLENWVVWGTSYAVQSGNAEHSNTSTNATMINGHRIVEMSEEEFNNAVKDEDTYYLVY